MAFKLAETDYVWWPTVIEVPVDGGDTSPHQLEAQYDLLSQDEYNKLNNDDIVFLIRVVKDWKDVTDHNDQPLPCTKENKLKMFKSRGYIRLGFLNAYHEAVTGIKAKNLKGQPASGHKDRKPRNRKSTN